jgi:hypothetical protein
MAEEPFFPSMIGRSSDPDSGRDVFVGGNEDVYQIRTKLWLENAYEEAKSELSNNKEIAKVSKYISYLEGDQWVKNRPNYKSSPVDNRIWRLMWELIAILTDIRPIFEIKSTKKEYERQAEMLNKVTKSWWLTSDSDMTLAQIIMYAILTTGYAKLTWNQELRMGEGDFDLVPIGPEGLLLLKPRHTLQSSQAVIYKTLMPLGWFRERFGARGGLVRPDSTFSRYATPQARPGHISAAQFDALSPQMKRMVGIAETANVSAYPQALYREFWLKDYTYNESDATVHMGRPLANWAYRVPPGKRLYPRGRLIAMGGPIILYDGPNPYWHGQYPFAALRMNAVPWQFPGLSDISPLIPLQDIINNILAGVLDMVKKAVNPGFYGPKNAFSESMWDTLDWSMPGLKAAYNQNAGTPPQFAPAVQLPSFVLQTLTMAAREMDQSSGLAAITESLKKKQVPSGETLDRIKEAQQTPLRLKGRNIEVFLRDLGSQNIYNIFQFYTAERRMQMLGNDGLTFEDFDWDPGTAIPAGVRPEDHAKAFVFMIQPGSLLNVNKIDDLMIFRALRMSGDLDRKTLFEKLNMPGLNLDKVEAGLKREIQEGISLHPPKPAKGGGGAPGPK